MKNLKLPSKKVLGLAVVLLLLAALPFIVRVVRDRTGFFSSAAGENSKLSFASSFIDSSASVILNNTIDVPVFVNTDGANISGVDLVIQFNTANLALQSITPDPQNSTTFDTFAPVNIDGTFNSASVVSTANTTGVIEFGGVTYDWGLDQVTAPFNGAAQIATLRFLATSVGTSDITFSAAAGSTTDSNIVQINPVVDLITNPVTQVTRATVTVTGGVGPTNTPTNTPTDAPPINGSLNFQFRYQGVSSDRGTKTVQVLFRQGGNIVRTENGVGVTSNASGIYSGAVTNVTSGTYDILIKSPLHLQKLVAGVTIDSSGTTNWPTTLPTLLGGDINNNNFVDLADYALLASVFAPGVSKVSNADVNYNGYVDIADYSILASNFQPGVPGPR